jgi:flagellar M-ring protein FliF
MSSSIQVQKQLTDVVAGLSVKQRFLLGGAAVVTIAVLAAFVHLIAEPDYKPLMTDMEPTDAQGLAEKLAAKNISYQIGPDGKSVSVPSDKLDASRMEIAAGGMPRSGRLGFELFDKMNWGQTEFDEKVNYQRALEGELERSIQTLKDVESSRVHLVLATDSVFLNRERAAKASVVLKLKSGRLSHDSQLAIARLVSGAVDNLSPDNVTVLDADTNEPLGSPKRDVSSADGNLDQDLTTRLIQTLAPVIGTEHVKASVNVEFDPRSAEETSESYDPKGAVAVSTQRSEEQVGGTLAGGVPGTSSNVPEATTNSKTEEAVDPGDATQVSKSESNTYAVTKVARHSLEPAGRIRRITAALLIDDAIEVKLENGKRTETRRKRTADELKQIEELAKAAIGIDLTRGDSVTIQNLSFEQPLVEPLPKPNVPEKIRVILNDWSSVVRYGAIFLLFLLVYALLLRPLKKQVVTTLRELPNAAAVPVRMATDDLLPQKELTVLPPEQQRALTIKNQLMEKAKGEPAATSRLVQSWMHEGAK